MWRGTWQGLEGEKTKKKYRDYVVISKYNVFENVILYERPYSLISFLVALFAFSFQPHTLLKLVKLLPQRTFALLLLLNRNMAPPPSYCTIPPIRTLPKCLQCKPLFFSNISLSFIFPPGHLFSVCSLFLSPFLESKHHQEYKLAVSNKPLSSAS